MEDAAEGQVERILTPIMEQLAALQRQVAGMSGDRLPTPEGAKQQDVPDMQELSLKRPANRDQYRFCRSISTLAEKALSCFDEKGDLVKTGGASKAVRDLIQSVVDLSSKRQKNIRLADRSEAAGIWSHTTRRTPSQKIRTTKSESKALKKLLWQQEPKKFSRRKRDELNRVRTCFDSYFLLN